MLGVLGEILAQGYVASDGAVLTRSSGTDIGFSWEAGASLEFIGDHAQDSETGLVTLALVAGDEDHAQDAAAAVLSIVVSAGAGDHGADEVAASVSIDGLIGGNGDHAQDASAGTVGLQLVAGTGDHAQDAVAAAVALSVSLGSNDHAQDQVAPGFVLAIVAGNQDHASDQSSAGLTLAYAGGAGDHASDEVAGTVTITPASSGYVLDSLSSGAQSAVVVAYSSARRLTSSYSGSLIRLRRDSDDEEADYGYDGSGDLDVASIATWVGSGDAYLVTIYDQSGNGNDLTQSTAANQIPFVVSGTIQTCGGQPAPYSTASAGSGAYLGVCDSAVPLGASDFAIWAVHERISGETQPLFAAWFADGNYLGWDASTNNLCACAIGGYSYAPRASASYLGTTGGTTDETKCIIANFDVSTQIEAFVNSTSSFGTNSLVDASDYNWQAAGIDAGYFPMYGPIAEIVVFDGQLLDSSDRSLLMADGTTYYT